MFIFESSKEENTIIIKKDKFFLRLMITENELHNIISVDRCYVYFVDDENFAYLKQLRDNVNKGKIVNVKKNILNDLVNISLTGCSQLFDKAPIRESHLFVDNGDIRVRRVEEKDRQYISGLHTTSNLEKMLSVGFDLLVLEIHSIVSGFLWFKVAYNNAVELSLHCDEKSFVDKTSLTSILSEVCFAEMEMMGVESLIIYVSSLDPVMSALFSSLGFEDCGMIQKTGLSGDILVKQLFSKVLKK